MKCQSCDREYLIDAGDEGMCPTCRDPLFQRPIVEYDNYDCPDCDGHGFTECESCGNETECDTCDGMGLDPDKVDFEKWKEADKKFFANHKKTWALMDGKRKIGRTCESGERLLYRDFPCLKVRC